MLINIPGPWWTTPPPHYHHADVGPGPGAGKYPGASDDWNGRSSRFGNAPGPVPAPKQNGSAPLAGGRHLQPDYLSQASGHRQAGGGVQACCMRTPHIMTCSGGYKALRMRVPPGQPDYLRQASGGHRQGGRTRSCCTTALACTV